MTLAIALDGVSKSFGGVPAVKDVSFSIAAGEVVSLAGENGAGKSTIKNMIGGLLRPDSGTIRAFGEAQGSSVSAVRAQGIATVHQEISLFPHLTVAENILINKLGNRARFGVDQRALQNAARPYLDRLGARISPATRVDELATGETQLVEIAKALAAEPRLLILDEPTASLTMSEREYVFAAVETLRDDRVAVLFISHFLDEIFRLSDRIVVLRDGALVADRYTGDYSRSRLEEEMVGRELAAGFPKLESPRDVIALSVRDLGDGAKIEGVSFDIHQGEIFGLSGLMGSGRTEVARAIFGLTRYSGNVDIAGSPLTRESPSSAIAAGLGFVTEDRRDEGIFLERPIAETLSATVLSELARPAWSGVLDKRRERIEVAEQAKKVGLTARGGLWANGSALSGGNQQKVVIGKWLRANPRVLILDEPTRGIDIGAKAEIYRMLAALAAEGIAILLISSEMEELLGMSHRIGVMASGRLRGVLPRAEVDQKKLIRLATGGEL